MKIIYKSEPRNQVGVKLDDAEVSSLAYHDIFNYPLTLAELIKWRAGGDKAGADREHEVVYRKGFYYLQGRESFVITRLMRQRASKRKLPLAKRAARVLALLPSVKMVAITGALAMQNAGELSDIDLLVIVSKKTLWVTRLASIVILRLFKVKVRRHAEKNEKDKICLNMWLDEADLVWRKRNPYSAHELAQIVPLVNKNASYEDLMMKNKWVQKYWPNAVRIGSKQQVADSKGKGREQRLVKYLTTYYILLATLIEPLARKMQFLYMKRKITRETVTPTRALFHPIDWEGVVISKLELLR